VRGIFRLGLCPRALTPVLKRQLREGGAGVYERGSGTLRVLSKRDHALCYVLQDVLSTGTGRDQY